MGKEALPPTRPAGKLLRGRVALRCTFCHDDLERGAAVFCAACLAPHHTDCHSEHGKCAGPGCGETSAVRPSERRRGARLFTVSLMLLLTGGLVAVLVPAEESRAPGGLVPPAGAKAQAKPEAEVAPSARRLFRLETDNLSLTTRGFDYSIRLENGERLLLRSESGGYVHVLRVPPSEHTWRERQVVMVVEPGDAIHLQGPHVRHTLKPSPGHSIEIEWDGQAFGVVELGPQP